MKNSLLGTALVGVLLTGCAANRPDSEHRPPRSPEPHAPGSSTPAGPTGPASDARHCVALAMYWEARGEGREGMAAVGAVIENRVRSNAFPDSHCAVVYQGGETPPCQFSWWCDGKSDRPTDAGQWALAQRTAAAVLAGDVGDPTDGALFFHSTTISRPWNRTQTARIGGHVFYR